MDEFENEEEYANYLAFSIPQSEIDDALSLYKNQLIKEPFQYDNWSAANGVKYLAGIFEYGENVGSQYLRKLDNVYYETNPSLYIIRAFLARLEEYTRIWESGEHPEKSPPNYYIEWALSKGLEIGWLRHSLEQKLLRLENISAFPLLASSAEKLSPCGVVNVEQQAKSEELMLSTNQMTSHLNIIGAMLDIMLGKTAAGKPNSIYGNQSAIVSALVEKHGEKYGLSESNLDKIFPKAKKSLESN